MSYDAFTHNALRDQLAWKGYILKWTPNENHLGLFECGGYRTIRPSWERSTGEIFDSVQVAHRYAIMEAK
jgi:hypothetical protein